MQFMNLPTVKISIIILFLIGCDNPHREFADKKNGLDRCISILGSYEGIGLLIPHELSIDKNNQKSIETAEEELRRYYQGLTISDFQELMKLMSELKVLEINDNTKNTRFSITTAKGYAFSKDSDLVSNEYVIYEKLDSHWFYWENKK